MSNLSEALFTQTQRNLLRLLYGQPDNSFYFKQILRNTGMGVATIKRELARMQQAGIVRMERIGNQHHYQANRSCPIYGELISIVRKTFGVVEVLRLALTPLQEQIDLAFVYGSIASGKDIPASDIDLLIVGDVEFNRLVEALYPLQEVFSREINPKIFRHEEWEALSLQHDGFVLELMNSPRMIVIEATDGSGKPGRYQCGKS